VRAWVRWFVVGQEVWVWVWGRGSGSAMVGWTMTAAAPAKAAGLAARRSGAPAGPRVAPLSAVSSKGKGLSLYSATKKSYPYEATLVFKNNVNVEGAEHLPRYIGALEALGVIGVQAQQGQPMKMQSLMHKQREGVFVQLYYEGDGTAATELSRQVAISEDVLRVVVRRLEALPGSEEEMNASMIKEAAPPAAEGGEGGPDRRRGRPTRFSAVK